MKQTHFTLEARSRVEYGRENQIDKCYQTRCVETKATILNSVEQTTISNLQKACPIQLLCEYEEMGALKIIDPEVYSTF